jgi:hypothetical protein
MCDTLSLHDALPIFLPSGAVDQDALLTYQRVTTPVSAPGLKGLDKTFTITLTKASDGTPIELASGAAYSVSISYADIELGVMDENTLALYYWDGTNWVKDPTSHFDPSSHTISATPNHFSNWAVMGQFIGVYLPIVQR